MAALDHVLMPAKQREWITPAIIGLMLVLRLVVLGLGGWLLKGPPVWLDPLYDTSTYLLTLFLIWWERDRLSDYHIGWLAVGIILVFKPIQTILLAFSGMDTQSLPMALPGLPALILWAATLVMLALLIAARPALRKISPVEKRWFGLGILIGILTAMVLSFPMAVQIRMLGDTVPFQPTFVSTVLFSFLRDFPYQLGYAAVSEEPLFRGFLWGYLRRVGWQDRWIWLFQAGLFMLAHIYYINRLPYSFWIIVPVASLVLGWLAWHSRSIATSMAAHATLNALGMPFGLMVKYWLFR